MKATLKDQETTCLKYELKHCLKMDIHHHKRTTPKRCIQNKHIYHSRFCPIDNKHLSTIFNEKVFISLLLLLACQKHAVEK